jgi:diadenosine tetraphosphate (Ap4A) HIT family hydrolase
VLTRWDIMYLSASKGCGLLDRSGQNRTANSELRARGCALCVAVADATGGGESFLHNRKLMETERFVVLPSVGPVVPGHVMVVSKSHWHSLASMGPLAIREYESLAARLRTAPLLRDADPLEAEHGATGEDKAGACVIHTHVHWVPGMGQFWNEFKQHLSLRRERDLFEVSNNGGTYIFVRASAKRAIYEAQGLRSQTIRRILCGILDREDTDWMQALRPDWVEETVKAWDREEDMR